MLKPQGGVLDEDSDIGTLTGTPRKDQYAARQELTNTRFAQKLLYLLLSNLLCVCNGLVQARLFFLKSLQATKVVVVVPK